MPAKSKDQITRRIEELDAAIVSRERDVANLGQSRVARPDATIVYAIDHCKRE